MFETKVKCSMCGHVGEPILAGQIIRCEQCYTVIPDKTENSDNRGQHDLRPYGGFAAEIWRILRIAL